MIIVLDTQYYENYGAHSWDGEGECPQYWKPKGGSTYYAQVTLEEALSSLKAIAAALTDRVTERNEYCEEYVLDWNLYDSLEEAQAEYPEWYELQELGR